MIFVWINVCVFNKSILHCGTTQPYFRNQTGPRYLLGSQSDWSISWSSGNNFVRLPAWSKESPLPTLFNPALYRLRWYFTQHGAHRCPHEELTKNGWFGPEPRQFTKKIGGFTRYNSPPSSRRRNRQNLASTRSKSSNCKLIWMLRGGEGSLQNSQHPAASRVKGRRRDTIYDRMK